jgi:hypothetical protein
MKPIFALPFVLFAGLLAGCGLNLVQGSGNVVSETRTVSNFHAIDLSGTGELQIQQGDTETLTIKAEDNILPYLKSEVVGGTLQLGAKSPTTAIHPTQTIIYVLTVKNLDAVNISGSGNLTMPALKTNRLDVSVSGMGNINIDELTTDNLSLSVSGSGKAKLAGAATNQTIHISGSGDYNAGDLKSDTTSISVSGSGNLTVWAIKSMNVSISGSGSVSYYGKPNITQNISGVGKISGLGEK